MRSSAASAARLVGPYGLPGLVDRVVALARMDAHAAALHLDVDLAELAVEGVVLRHVRQHVVVPHVRLDPREPPAQIVRVLDQEPAGLVGELAEAGARVHAQEILVALEVRHHRAAGMVGAGPPRIQLALVVDLVAHLADAALGAQPHRVHRVDAHVRAVGGVDDRAELLEDVRRNRHALREEDDALPAGDRLHAVDDGKQRVGAGEAGLIALERVERLRHRGRHRLKLRLAASAPSAPAAAPPAAPPWAAAWSDRSCRSDALICCASAFFRSSVVDPNCDVLRLAKLSIAFLISRRPW